MDGTGNLTKMFFAQGEQVAGIPYYFTRDHLGSVREMTGNNGAIHGRYDYDPYGNVTKIQGDMDSDFGFTGDYVHAASGLNLTLYRAYDPVTARWLSRDPLENAEMAQGPNLYTYVSNNSINREDPFGLFVYYGNWGGPNWTGGYKKPWNKLTPAEQQDALNNPLRGPIDAQDECYKEHDICYGGCKCFSCRWKCDSKLLKCLTKLASNHDPNYNYHALGGIAAFALHLGALTSFGD
ncbi:MAG: RHS repeat-associated core domain-containing protein [Opitutaceae bacterium]